MPPITVNIGAPRTKIKKLPELKCAKLRNALPVPVAELCLSANKGWQDDMRARRKTFHIGRIWLWQAALILIAALLVSGPLQAQQQLPAESLSIETSSGKRLFEVEIARTIQQHVVGLMWRTEMAPDHGMLFDMGKARNITMWMKNTPLSLDILFIMRDGRVVSIATDTTPFSTEHILSGAKVNAVLELLGGTAQRLGIAPGDVVRHSLFGSQP